MKEILINSTQMRYTEYWLPQTALTHEACEFITIYALYADGIRLWILSLSRFMHKGSM